MQSAVTARRVANTATGAHAAQDKKERTIFIQPVVRYLTAAERKPGSHPITWPELVDELSITYSGQPPVSMRWGHLLSSSGTYLSWGPTAQAILASFLGRHVVHLCWGTPARKRFNLLQGLKEFRLKLLLKKATVVAVNEETSRADVKTISGRDAVVVPFVVDTDFFQYAPHSKRSDFIVVPGNNDRNEALVHDLAELGHQIVRVTWSDSVKSYHESRSSCPNLEVKHKAPYLELRWLYQNAKAVLLPLVSDNHAAGQTAMLEAVACGAPVVISRGRASSICDRFASVISTSSSELQDWCECLTNVESSILRDECLLRQSAENVASTHHPDVVVNALIDLIESSRTGSRNA